MRQNKSAREEGKHLEVREQLKIMKRNKLGRGKNQIVLQVRIPVRKISHGKQSWGQKTYVRRDRIWSQLLKKEISNLVQEQQCKLTWIFVEPCKARQERLFAGIKSADFPCNSPKHLFQCLLNWFDHLGLFRIDTAFGIPISKALNG